MWGIDDDRDYADQVLRYATTDNGVFAIKVHSHQLPHASWLTGEEPLTALADRVDFCLVRRRDEVRQAVSVYIAAETGRYTRRVGDGAAPPVDVPFDADRIGERLAEVRDGDRLWSEYFADHGVEPVHVWYEDDLEVNCVETTRRLLAIFDVDASPDLQVTIELEKQADRALRGIRQTVPRASGLTFKDHVPSVGVLTPIGRRCNPVRGGSRDASIREGRCGPRAGYRARARVERAGAGRDDHRVAILGRRGWAGDGQR